MATKRQRRRREREQRHEYMWVDDEGNELESEERTVREPPKRAGASKSKSSGSGSSSARRGRAPQPPSWRRVIKRGAIFAPLFLATLLLLGHGHHVNYVSAVGQALVLLALFIPFSYFLDSMMWRSYQKKTGQNSTAKR
jgi:hypothetical protein